MFAPGQFSSLKNQINQRFKEIEKMFQKCILCFDLENVIEKIQIWTWSRYFQNQLDTDTFSKKVSDTNTFSKKYLDIDIFSKKF